MYAPAFKITNKTLLNLISVETAGKIIALAQLQPEWEVRLKQESVARRIFSMARFSGNGLNIEEIAKIVKDEPGRDDKAVDVAFRAGVVGKEKDIQQVLNIMNTNRLTDQMAYLAGKFKQGDFGEKDLAQINALLGERLIPVEELGRLRMKNDPSMAGSNQPLVVEIPLQMEDLFSWFKSTTRNEIHPINKAGIMFHEILRINPFSDNNLLSAISFFQLSMASDGYGFKKLWAVEEEILKNNESFQAAMTSVERNAGELTIWIEYLSRCLSEAAEKALTKVMNLVGDAPIFKSDGGKVISLSERQIGIMEEMTLRNEMTIKEIRSILPLVSDDTILRDLKDLIGKKLIRKRGKTKGAVYVMGKIRSYR